MDHTAYVIREFIKQRQMMEREYAERLDGLARMFHEKHVQSDAYAVEFQRASAESSNETHSSRLLFIVQELR